MKIRGAKLLYWRQPGTWQPGTWHVATLALGASKGLTGVCAVSVVAVACWACVVSVVAVARCVLCAYCAMSVFAVACCVLRAMCLYTCCADLHLLRAPSSHVPARGWRICMCTGMQRFGTLISNAGRRYELPDGARHTLVKYTAPRRRVALCNKKNSLNRAMGSLRLAM